MNYDELIFKISGFALLHGNPVFQGVMKSKLTLDNGLRGWIAIC
jgi:hypothetical protein